MYLVPFTYSDQQRTKRRPACVLSIPDFNAGPDVVLDDAVRHVLGLA